jgi:hypothetical protein
MLTKKMSVYKVIKNVQVGDIKTDTIDVYMESHDVSLFSKRSTAYAYIEERLLKEGGNEEKLFHFIPEGLISSDSYTEIHPIYEVREQYVY